MSMAMEVDQHLDVSGLNCPLPILRAKKALATMEAGAVLEIIATDPAAPADFVAFCRQTGHELMQSDTREDGKFRLIIKRKASQ